LLEAGPPFGLLQLRSLRCKAVFLAGAALEHDMADPGVAGDRDQTMLDAEPLEHPAPERSEDLGLASDVR
jgi:hypothetical protein